MCIKLLVNGAGSPMGHIYVLEVAGLVMLIIATGKHAVVELAFCDLAIS